jgi:serine-type D-Ala-D-Ala carboxypeptidase (penicillin-binding protein 5/6)
MPARPHTDGRWRLRARSVAAVTLATLLGLAPAYGASAAATGSPSGSPLGSPVGGPQLAIPTTVWQAAPAAPRPPEIPARGYLLADLATGQILVAHDVHRPLLTASTMKVLTALTLLPRLDPNAVYTARRTDAAVDGSKVGIVPGSTYTVHQLFLGMMLSSGNDAATALADAAGGVPATVSLMQQQAATLGAFDTTVRDPSGLDAPGQRSSAYDLALITRAAMDRPDFRGLAATKTAEFPGKIVNGKRSKGFQIQNHNELLSHYRGAIGVKTGYTEAAKWTYIGAARRGAHTYVVTELGLSQPGWMPTTRLLNWAFAYGSSLTPVGRLVTPAEVAAAAVPTAGPTSRAPALAAGPVPLPTGAYRTRWLGAGGLLAAAAIVAALALNVVRRRVGSPR